VAWQGSLSMGWRETPSSEAKVHNSRLLIRVLLRRLDDVIDLVDRDLDVERLIPA
jgi:hypothetical protein